MQSDRPAPHPPATAVRRYLALDSLRGICACAVVLYHLPTTGLITNSAFVRGGWMFVDFFFVLSGFVISAGYVGRLAQGFPVRTFLAMRLGRVYPLHIAMLLLYLAMEVAALVAGGTGGLAHRAPFTGGRDWPSWFGNAALLQIFGLRGTLTWNIPSWSIAAEIWTYALMAVAVSRLGSGRAMLLAVGGAVAASLAVLALLGPPFLDRTYSWALVRCVYGFGLGMLGYRAHRGFAGAGRIGGPLATLGEAALVAGCIAFVCLGGHTPATLACPPLFLLAVLVFAREEGALSRLLRMRAPVLLGTLSYSIYMIHHFVEGRFLDLLKLAGRMAGAPAVAWDDTIGWRITASQPIADGLAIVALGVVIGCSFVSYRLIEEPCRRWSRRVAMRRGAGAAETVAPAL